MIQRLNISNQVDVKEFIKNTKDYYSELYITYKKERLFLNNEYILEKILKHQEIYGIFETELTGILLIFREKGFRPYVKFLTKDRDSQSKLIKFLMWNFSEKDLYLKLKKENPLSKYIQKFGFIFLGDRGTEILLYRKGIKKINIFKPKDEQE